MRVVKIGRTVFNLDALAKVSSLEKALDMHPKLPIEDVEKAWKKANPDKKKATSKTKEE